MKRPLLSMTADIHRHGIDVRLKGLQPAYIDLILLGVFGRNFGQIAIVRWGSGVSRFLLRYRTAGWIDRALFLRDDHSGQRHHKLRWHTQQRLSRLA